MSEEGVVAGAEGADLGEFMEAFVKAMKRASAL